MSSKTLATENAITQLIKLNCLLAESTRSRHYTKTLNLFQQMHASHNLKPDHYSLSTTLTACANHRNILFGTQVHCHSIKSGLKKYIHVSNTLLSLYAKSERLGSVKRVFEGIESPDVYSWTTLLSACSKLGEVEYACKVFDEMSERKVEVGCGGKCLMKCRRGMWRFGMRLLLGVRRMGREIAFGLFRRMGVVGVRRDNYTFASVLSLCCGEIEGFGRGVHSLVIKTELPYKYTRKLSKLAMNCTSVRNAAMTMYSTCGDLDTAHLVFQEMQEKDTVSWNTIITGYAQGHLAGAAILAYLQMQSEGIRPDEFTVGSLLASTEMLVSVEMILAVVFKYGLFSNTQVSNALLSAFFKYSEIKQAYEVFNGMCHRNLISWNSLISGLQLNGFLVEGLVEFTELLKSDMSPNAYSFSISLSICATISALKHGKQIHGYILKNGYFQQTSLGNAIITLYAKSGDLDRSVKVFKAMNEKDNISWNSMISAYAQHGEGIEAARCFEVMQDSAGIKPDKATFTAVLSACSHAGLVDNGIHIFNSMVNKYGFEPGVDHFSCIVDLLGRAGHLDIAEKLITTKLIDIDSNIWWTLFSSCAAHGNLRCTSESEAQFLVHGIRTKKAFVLNHYSDTTAMALAGIIMMWRDEIIPDEEIITVFAELIWCTSQ
ncbi:hypothetical protein AG4045_023993 [Apium graveolens]|uniref:Pentacotripeptide-repeat region of PRORP domain-containing protein n=1 Tax=Apium graveolens TaxID=4045 RepID=A0A6L5B809_APIGR|nr:hypothetical protein AG4045_023993 [Apium graveolens]